MASLTMAALLFFISFFFSALASSAASAPVGGRKMVIRGAYWPSWRSSSSPATAIDTTYFTHIYFSFLVLDPATYRLRITQPEADLLRNFTAALRSKKPAVKMLVSIGGGDSNRTAFAQMAGSAANRAAFIGSTVAVARVYGLHGFDLDWESPRTPAEMADFGTLLSEWRVALRPRRMLLTAAVYFAPRFILGDGRSFPIASIVRNLDWINVMCYDYKGSWDTSATGAHAALYDSRSNVSTSFGLSSWVRARVPARMVAMGLPVYGRTWTLRDRSITGIGAPAVGVGPGGGTLIFKDVLEFNARNNATVVYDNATVSTYSYYGKTWIGYDDATSAVAKIRYAQGLNVGGYFFWALGYDQDWMISREAWRAWS